MTTTEGEYRSIPLMRVHLLTPRTRRGSTPRARTREDEHRHPSHSHSHSTERPREHEAPGGVLDHAVLLQDLGDGTGTDRAATLADGEAEALFHGDRLDEVDPVSYTHLTLPTSDLV